ncbi:hypothetical protein vBPaeMUSP18_42 [Pseudomonas phage vB_PaeM_USP_18]|nr:hypothetical protein vBPaeMUSP18_42 [Pseudomonas phage vB_PaeM_USP_18]QLI49523.1 hypothetical protein vBPaeMUSP25_42 [Pseudomonas phage vB_PaeM_USP_25]
MAITIPPLALIRTRLEAMKQAQIKSLAKDSGVPFGTLMKIRHGITKNPGIETVRAFFPLLPDLPGRGDSPKRRHDDSV